MEQIQEQLHVEPRIPSAPNEIHCLSTGYDLLRRLRVIRNRRAIWYVYTTTPTHPIHI
jgi:hypothetical protein